MKRTLFFSFCLMLSGIGFFGVGCGTQEAPPSRPWTWEAVPLSLPEDSRYPDLWIGDDGWKMSFTSMENDTLGRIFFLEQGGQAEKVAEGDRMFINWADFPRIFQADQGQTYLHWLEKNGSGTYAYGVKVALQKAGQAAWTLLGSPHEQKTETEHGFNSFFSLQGRPAMVWLDGREYAGDQKAMSLRTAHFVTEAELSADTLLDPRICDCCQTGAVATEKGAVIVYRDRSEDEIRDVYRVAYDGTSWTEPAPVARDQWMINGCPVNGPAVASKGDEVVVAWFTQAENIARVKVAFSRDGGITFGDPIVLDEEKAIGRVGVVWQQEQAWVSWLARKAEGAAVYLQGFSEGEAYGPVQEVVEMDPGRKSGFPILRANATGLWLAYTEVGNALTVRLLRAK
ncbi:MAG: hypothetical protein AAFR61_26250 [Bacteroidota bacterium]